MIFCFVINLGYEVIGDVVCDWKICVFLIDFDGGVCFVFDNVVYWFCIIVEFVEKMLKNFCLVGWFLGCDDYL